MAPGDAVRREGEVVNVCPARVSGTACRPIVAGGEYIDHGHVMGQGVGVGQCVLLDDHALRSAIDQASPRPMPRPILIYDVDPEIAIVHVHLVNVGIGRGDGIDRRLDVVQVRLMNAVGSPPLAKFTASLTDSRSRRSAPTESSI